MNNSASEQCTGHTWKPKLRFERAVEASDYRRENKQIGDKRIYECPRCHGFHLATRTKRVIKRGYVREPLEGESR